MPKINYRRKNWLPKMPVKKVNKVQVPDSIYDRNKEKEKLLREIRRVNYENL
jgi:hypothetical protein